MRSYDKGLSMKLKNLFEKEVLQEAKEKNLIGLKINGKLIDENTPNEKWEGHFICDGRFLTSLEGSPRVVDGYFSCVRNELASLEGSPREVDDFDCGSNHIETLEGGPTKVNGSFACNSNRLTTLEGAPEFVGSHFHCESNELFSLKGAPQSIGGGFQCSSNQLTSLEGGPTRVNGYFSCTGNELLSLEGAPSEIGSYFNCNNNQLVSLHNIHKHIKKMNGAFYARGNPIKSHVLGLMLIDGIIIIELNNRDVESIINRGIKNRKHWTEVQAELEEAGFEEYAQL